MASSDKTKKTSDSDASEAAATWTNNNLACVYTWLDLTFIKENKEEFDKSGSLKMPQLRFWNPTASPEARKIEAMQVAVQLAKMFTGVNFAKFETGKNFETAVQRMTAVLTNEEMAMSDLALVADDNYNFFGETKV